MRLLGSVVRSQRWGIARVRPPGWALYFKGGWGSGSGAVDHQVALLRRGGRRLAVAIMTTSSPSHEYAQGDARGSGAAASAPSRPRRDSGGLGRALGYPAMDLTLSPSEEAFRDELRAWLADNHPGEDPPDDDAAFEHRRVWQKKLHEAGYAGFSWPQGVRRPRRHADRAGDLRRGDGARQGAQSRPTCSAWSWAARW